MAFERLHHDCVAYKAVVSACAFALAVTPLVGCGKQQQTTSDETASATATQTAAADPSSWKTLGDALTAQTEGLSAAWNDSHYVVVFKVGDSYYRVVGKIDATIDQKISDVDWSKGDANEQIIKIVAEVPLESAEDITSDALTQAELDALVGKTGQELVDAGFTFSDYYMYGGEETGASFDRGYFSYAFTFDTTVSEDQTADGGASLMGATIKQFQFINAANDATDPSKVS